MIKFTRRQLANYAAEQIIAGNDQIFSQLGAYLYETNRIKEDKLLIREINSALYNKGYVVAEVSSQHELDSASRNELKDLLSRRYKTNNISVDESIDSDLLGGIKIKTACEEFDGSLRRKINRLKMTKA